MEFVDGMSLRQLLASERLAPAQALKVVPQICEALEYAHAQGMVHRDIKPENILIDKAGRVKIADFGLAKMVAKNGATLTRTSVAMGTPQYMAPEQYDAMKDVDHRADIYSLGVVFYEMLTGEVPAGAFQPPSKKVEVDARLDEVVLKAMAREPERCYQRASDVRVDIEGVEAPIGAGAAAASSPARHSRAAIGSLVVFIIAAVSAAIGGILGGGSTWKIGAVFHVLAGAAFLASIVLAFIGRSRINTSGGRLGGRGYTTATLTLAALAVCFIGFMYVIFAKVRAPAIRREQEEAMRRALEMESKRVRDRARETKSLALYIPRAEELPAGVEVRSEEVLRDQVQIALKLDQLQLQLGSRFELRTADVEELWSAEIRPGRVLLIMLRSRDRTAAKVAFRLVPGHVLTSADPVFTRVLICRDAEGETRETAGRVKQWLLNRP